MQPLPGSQQSPNPGQETQQRRGEEPAGEYLPCVALPSCLNGRGQGTLLACRGVLANCLPGAEGQVHAHYKTVHLSPVTKPTVAEFASLSPFPSGHSCPHHRLMSCRGFLSS